jgi:Icc-related predicted phosphoesterase
VKIQLLSDLHLEVDPSFVPTPAPDADVLVLAGDIGALPDTPMARHGRLDWHLTAFSPKLNHWPVPVLYVPGNHEFDGQDLDVAYTQLRALCDTLGITWLEGQSINFNGVRFVGSTLWSDFEALSDWPDEMPGAITHNLKMRDKAFRAADFYLLKAGTRRNGVVFDAAAVRQAALQCQTFLRDQLAQPFDGKTVVVTHFAPTLKSHDPRYGLTPGTAGFCNALDDLVAQAHLWLHGHLHCASNYPVGKCRVRANPLGYKKRGEQDAFAPHCVITV